MPQLHGEGGRPARRPGSRRRPGMLRTISTDEAPRRAAARRLFPARRLHLIDIENLAGTGLPTAQDVHRIRETYASRVGIGPSDHVVIACNHLAMKAAGFNWPGARYLVRSGPDGADLALLDVIRHENVPGRFTSVAIASGDHAFTADTSLLGAAGCEVTVV